MSKFARLKPYNPKRGCVLQKFTHAPTGKKFEEAQGWYVIDDALAAYLVNARQIPSDPESIPAFDIVDEATAHAIDAREKKEKQRRDANDAQDLTTADLRLREESKSPAMERARARSAREAAEVERAQGPWDKARAQVEAYNRGEGSGGSPVGSPKDDPAPSPRKKGTGRTQARAME